MTQSSRKKKCSRVVRLASEAWRAAFGNELERYEARHALISAAARANGFRLYNKNLAWLQDIEYRDVWSGFPFGARSIHERKFNLYYLAKSIRNIPGDLAECGVFHGASSYLMLTANAGTGKHLHGFDSFEGLSEPEDVDLKSEGRTFKWAKHDMTFDQGVTERNLESHAGRFTLYKGWIPTRFDEVAEKTFSLVHIDVDLYQPTLDALKFFYPRLSPGGMIVCDDYGFDSCPGARSAMDEFVGGSPEGSVVHLTTGQGLVVRHPK